MGLIKLVNWQGWLGISTSLILAVFLGIQSYNVHHWRAQSAAWQIKYEQEHLAFGQTVLNYRVAAADARKADQTNAARVVAAQLAINQKKDADYEARIADARARADSLRAQLEASAHSGDGRDAPVPGLSTGPRGPDEASGEDGLSDALLATEQAIQLDELIKWVREQHAVNVNGDPHPSH